MKTAFPVVVTLLVLFHWAHSTQTGMETTQEGKSQEQIAVELERLREKYVSEGIMPPSAYKKPGGSANKGPDAWGVTLVNDGVRGACLQAHNTVRGLHKRTRLFEYDEKLERGAQKWAQHLARYNLFEHDGTRYGENLYKRWDWGTTEPASVAQAVYNWYEERHDYDIASGYSWGVTGHFTQVVWANTKRVGCGVAMVERSGFTETVVVARYAGAGNRIGEFQKRVQKYKGKARFPENFTELEVKY